MRRSPQFFEAFYSTLLDCNISEETAYDIAYTYCWNERLDYFPDRDF